MGSKDYAKWRRKVLPEAHGFLRGHFERLLPSESPILAVAGELVDEALREAFEVGFDHGRYVDYFESEEAFGVWIRLMSFREAIRLLIRHPDVEPVVNQLSAEQRRALVLIYVDRLPPGDAGYLLKVSPAEVSRREKDALQALFIKLQELASDPSDADE